MAAPQGTPNALKDVMSLCTLLPVFVVGVMTLCMAPGSAGIMSESGWKKLTWADPARQAALEEQVYDLQRTEHFDGADVRYWNQRYFVNKAHWTPGGPVFLVLGGSSEADPAWITSSAITEYAAQHGALLVMLEHRYYGNSQPVPDLTMANMKYLSSRQALADVARFIPYFRAVNSVPDTAKLLVFGGDYAGSLAAWFRAQYPYLADGAVTSSAKMVAVYDYQDFYVAAGEALDTVSTGSSCTDNIRDATGRMYDWWGQPDKRTMMENFFRLCHKINHDSMIDVTVFFYDLALNFADIVLHNNLNRKLPGGRGVSVSEACTMMNDEDRGDTIQRYGDVTRRVMDAHKTPCMDMRYTTLEAQFRQTQWNSTAVKEGRRQWLYQLCAEFGWARSSWSRKQPFGLWFTFPFNYTMDKCDSAFRFVNVDDSVQETNAYYGGLDITLDNVVFVNGGMDPWRTVGVTRSLPRSPGANIITIPGASHLADMYPPSAGDSPDLTMARQQISAIIGHWLAQRK